MSNPATGDEMIWVSVISATVGSLVTGLIALGITWINKKSEERRHLRELMFNAALENWKQSCNIAIERMKLGHGSAIAPVDTYIIHMMKLSELLINEKITKENIPGKLKEIRELTNAVKNILEKLDKPEKEEKKNT